MEELRILLTAFLIILLPVVAIFWFVLHGGVRLWKRTRPSLAYLCASVAIALTLLLTIPNLGLFLGRDLGGNVFLFLFGVGIYLLSVIPYGRIHRKLDFKTFAGIREINDDADTLLQAGPFAIVRHPRYLMVLIGVLGWSLAANYSGGYIVSILFVPALIGVILLEERELIDRFGDAYRAYQRTTPMLIPAPGKAAALFVKSP